jgi:integrase
MPKITDISIRNLPIPETGQVTYDDEGSPLKVRVSQGGSKTFLVILGSGRRHTIGRFGEVSLADARTAARRLKAERTLGKLLPSSTGLQKAIDEYLADIRVRPSTLSYYKRHLGRLQAAKLRDITPRDIHRIFSGLTDSSRLQVLRTYSAFFTWCVRRHYLDTSPCALMIGPKAKARSRTLTDDELRRVYVAAGELGNFGIVVRLCILTGQRKGELSAVSPTYLSDNCLTFPSHVTKNKREHSIPLSPTSKALFSRLKPVLTWSKPKAKLDKLSGVSGYTIHDLRRSFTTIHAKIGTPVHVIEALLNHKSGQISGVAATYNRYAYLKEMREALEKYEAYLEAHQVFG